MKTASVQHLNTLVNNREYATYHIEFNTLNRIGSYIMKKIMNVSPFLLLLIPVFAMMVFTISVNNGKATQDQAMLKTAPALTLKK